MNNATGNKLCKRNMPLNVFKIGIFRGEIAFSPNRCEGLFSSFSLTKGQEMKSEVDHMGKKTAYLHKSCVEQTYYRITG